MFDLIHELHTKLDQWYQLVNQLDKGPFVPPNHYKADYRDITSIAGEFAVIRLFLHDHYQKICSYMDKEQHEYLDNRNTMYSLALMRSKEKDLKQLIQHITIILNQYRDPSDMEAINT